MSWIKTPAVERPYFEFIRSEPYKAKRIRSYINSGHHLLAAGRTDEARHQFLQALNVFPHVTPALNSLAMIALSEGDVNRALEIVHESLRSDPKDPVAHSLAAQCWQQLESDPFMRAHAKAALENYMQLIQEGDPIEPEYPEKALLFVLQVLLLAEDDHGLIHLYKAQITRNWTPSELTWFGIAHFNVGDINEAFRLWKRAEKTGFFPAFAYVRLASHVMRHRLLPFRLDYEFVLPEEFEVFPFGTYSLVLAHAVNGIYGNAPPLEAQALLTYLVEQEIPGLLYFLQQAFHDETLPLGVRLLAAVHLIWLGEKPTEILTLYNSIDEANLPSYAADVADVAIPYYLLSAALAQIDGPPDDPESLQVKLQIGLAFAEQANELWAIELYHEMLAELGLDEDEIDTDNSDGGDML